jgi:hypothetical protein
MGQFQHQLRTSRGIEQSQSIVRDFFVLDEQRFVLEQEISVCVHKSEVGFFGMHGPRIELVFLTNNSQPGFVQMPVMASLKVLRGRG